MEKFKAVAYEAEAALLGCILLESSSLVAAKQSGICEDSFAVEKNRNIFRACCDLFAEGNAIDHLTVRQRLVDVGALSASGGETYLLKIVDDCPTATHAMSYAAVLKEKERLRALLGVAARIEHDATLGASASDIASSAISTSVAVVCSGNNAPVSPEHFHEEHVRRRELARTAGAVGYPLALLGSLDNLINSWNPPDNVIIAAKSSVGKTAFAINEVIPMLKRGIPVGIIETDMTEFAIRQRIAAHIADVNPFKFGRNSWTDEEAEKMDDAYRIMNKFPLYINDDSSATIDDVAAWTAAMVARRGIKVLIVDFLQQLNRTPSEYRDSYPLVVGNWSTRIKSLGKRYDLVTFVLSQFSRFGEKSGDVTPPLPTIEALKESSTVGQNADIVILLAFEPDKPKELYTFRHNIWDVVAIVDKQRDGPTGLVQLCMQPSRYKFMSRLQGTIITENAQQPAEQTRIPYAE